MLYREVIAFCFEICTQYINTLCGQNVEFWHGYVLREDGITASLTSYPVRCKILHQRTHSHKWGHAAAGMRAHNVLCNSYYATVITE
jgi:hypothetical protein